MQPGHAGLAHEGVAVPALRCPPPEPAETYVDFASYSPAAALEWRGYATVHAVRVLDRNGVI